MTAETKKVLARISKLCRENIAAFGKTYKPCWPSGAPMDGAKAEGRGVESLAVELLAEIRKIRREARKKYDTRRI